MDNEKRFVIISKEVQRTDTQSIVDTKTDRVLFYYWGGTRKELQPLVDMLNGLNDLVLDSLTPLD